MTALSVELMDITKDCLLLCDALPGLYCSWLQLLFVCGFVLPLVLSSASEMQAQSGWNQETDLAISEYFNVYLQKLLCFCCMFGSSSICTMKCRPINFAAFGWIWANSISLYTSAFFRLLLSSVTSSINTSNPVPLEAMHACAITLLHVSQMMLYALDHELFQAFSILFSSCHSGTGWS